jgi:outer membrane lipoprotein-sorting protein
MSRARVAALAVAAVAAASCGAPLLKLPTGAGTPASDSAEILTEASRTCRTISTISAEVAVTGTVGGQRIRGRILAGLSAPASMYLEAPAPFGAPLFVLAATDDDATLLLPRDRRVLEHGRPDQVLEAVAGVPLGPADLRSTLTGCHAASAETSNARAFGDSWRLVPGTRELYLHRQRSGEPWRLVSIVQPGPNGWRADYRDFLNDLPRDISLVSTDPRRFTLRLGLSQVEINVPLEPSTFRVSIPPGTEALTLDELRAGGPLSR